MENVTFERPELLPADVMELLGPLVDAARLNVAGYEDFAPIAFVGSTAKKRAVQLPTYLMGSPQVRGVMIREAAKMFDADFAVVFEEVYLAETNGKSEAEARAERDKYENVSDMPGAYCSIMMILETESGVWMARPRVEGDWETKTRRLGGELKFACVGGFNGKFAGLLPRKGVAQ